MPSSPFDAVILAVSPHAKSRVLGLTLVERARRVVTRAGANRVLVISSFADVAAHDYHLAPGSAAVDGGEELRDVREDRDGTPRPQGSRHDVGAYERPASPATRRPPQGR